jgi:hypothetical protein
MKYLLESLEKISLWDSRESNGSWFVFSYCRNTPLLLKNYPHGWKHRTVVDLYKKLCGVLGSRLNGVRQLPLHHVANYEYFASSQLVLSSSQLCPSVPLAVSQSRHSILLDHWSYVLPWNFREWNCYLRPCAVFRNMMCFTTPPNPPCWKTTSCRLSATAYSVYWQLSFISRCHISFRDLRTHQAVVTGAHPFCTFYDGMDEKNLYCTCLLFCFVEMASKRPVTEG